MADLMSAATAAQKVFELIKTLDDSRIDNKVKLALTEQAKQLNNDILQTQQTMILMNNTIQNLTSKATSLESQLKEKENFDQKIASFDLVEYGEKLWVYVHKKQHYPICPNCVNNNKISLLHQNGMSIKCSDFLQCGYEAVIRRKD